MCDALEKQRNERLLRPVEELKAELEKKKKRIQFVKGQIEHFSAEKTLLGCQMQELQGQLTKANRVGKAAEKSLAEYALDILREEDEGRGYFEHIMEQANARKNATILDASGGSSDG